MWIEDFRRANGYTRQQFSTALRAMAHRRRLRTVCPPNLIYMLETRPGCVTHPNIANLIAEATGATPEQRDSIVHKKHRGKWKPPRIAPLKRNAKPAPAPAPQPAFTPIEASESEPDACIAYNARPVAIIDREGNVLHRYSSVHDAALAANVAEACVYRRCQGAIKIEYEWDFYRKPSSCPKGATKAERHVFGISFRYIDVNGNPILTGTEGKTAPPPNAPPPVCVHGTHKRSKGRPTTVVAIDKDAREVARFDRQLDAADFYDVQPVAIWSRCNRKLKSDEYELRGVTFRYADEWDTMTEQDRQADARRTIRTPWPPTAPP